MQRHRSLARVAGSFSIVCCALLLLTVGVMTVRSGDFLMRQGWSPVERTPTEWPSLLALAPGGWTVSAVFGLAGLGTFALALAVQEVGNRCSPLIAGSLSISGIGLLGVAIPADLPNAERSWHGYVHNTTYNLIPLGVVLSMAAAAIVRGAISEWRPMRLSATISLGLLIGFILLTLVGQIAQLARYGVLATMLGWMLLLGAVHIFPPRMERSPNPRTRPSS